MHVTGFILQDFCCYLFVWGGGVGFLFWMLFLGPKSGLEDQVMPGMEPRSPTCKTRTQATEPSFRLYSV